MTWTESRTFTAGLDSSDGRWLIAPLTGGECVLIDLRSEREGEEFWTLRCRSVPAAKWYAEMISRGTVAAVLAGRAL